MILQQKNSLSKDLYAKKCFDTLHNKNTASNEKVLLSKKKKKSRYYLKTNQKNKIFLFDTFLNNFDFFVGSNFDCIL